MAFVVDASVTVAWFISNQATSYTNLVLERLTQEQIHAPRVWPLEFTNAFVIAQRRKLLARDMVSGAIERGGRLAILIDTAAVSMARLAQLAAQYNLTAYDASYLELALRLNLRLASKDEPLCAAARKAGLLLDLR